MRWLKKIAPPLLVLAAAIVALATLFTDHSAQYGRAVLPPGGTMTLPEGTVRVFVEGASDDGFQRRLTAPLRFRVRPVGGGEPLPARPTSSDGNSETATSRSQEFGGSGSVAKLEVPSAGGYTVSGQLGNGRVPVTLTFGTNPFSALVDKWHLWGGLLAAALLISILRMPSRHSEREEIAPAGTYLPPPYNG